MNRFNAADTIATILLIIGGLNWGSIGLTGVNFVESLFGSNSVTSDLVYILVGIAALYTIYTVYKMSNRELDTSTK